LKNLLIRTCPRRRIGERTIKDDGRRRAPKPSVFLERYLQRIRIGFLHDLKIYD